MKNERGSASAVFLVSCWVVALAGLLIAVDLGRLFFYREQLRTAADAAALAGSLQVERWVEVRVTRDRKVPGAQDFECSEKEGKPDEPERCKDTTVPDDYVKRGYERDVWDQWELLRESACNPEYYICKADIWKEEWTCWLKPKVGTWGDIGSVIEETFRANARGSDWGDNVDLNFDYPNEGELGGWVGREEFWVSVEAQATVPTLLLGPVDGRQWMTVRMDRPAFSIPIRRGADVREPRDCPKPTQ